MQQIMDTNLELTVKNHPGTLSHISGLFARRGFNLDGVLCMPLPDAARSRIWLRVRESERLEQVVYQLEKLVDVEQVRRHPADHAVFRQVEEFFQ